MYLLLVFKCGIWSELMYGIPHVMLDNKYKSDFQNVYYMDRYGEILQEASYSQRMELVDALIPSMRGRCQKNISSI